MRSIFSLTSFLLLAAFPLASIGITADETAKRNDLQGGLHTVVLADFEEGIPCSDLGEAVGFREIDFRRSRTVGEGVMGSEKSAVFRMDRRHSGIFFQGNVRRKYLATGNDMYVEDGPNTISFWIKARPDSPLVVKGERPGRKDPTLGVWTYHWRKGDLGVGGRDNRSRTTDSNMHGYSDILLTEKAAGKWVKVILSPSAFRIARNYYHFYAAQGVTDDLDFFASLRQLQFQMQGQALREETLQIDELKIEKQKPTAVFGKRFFRGEVAAGADDFAVPVTIRNPTDKDRHYRVFISSFLGVDREYLNKVFAQTDSLEPMRIAQETVGGDGGTGATALLSAEGEDIIAEGREIHIPAGGLWEGKIVHRIKPKMLGKQTDVITGKFRFLARRDTLTTSVIVWDPYDPVNNEMDHVGGRPSNADDGNHPAPPGFPPQRRPPQGWRSEDVPLNQVGGYFITVLKLTD